MHKKEGTPCMLKEQISEASRTKLRNYRTRSAAWHLKRSCRYNKGCPKKNLLIIYRTMSILYSHCLKSVEMIFWLNGMDFLRQRRHGRKAKTSQSLFSKY